MSEFRSVLYIGFVQDMYTRQGTIPNVLDQSKTKFNLLLRSGENLIETVFRKKYLPGTRLARVVGRSAVKQTVA